MPIPNINPVNSPVMRFVKLKQDIAVSALMGNYKGFKENCKTLATEAVKDFESCKESRFLSPQKVSLNSMSTIEKLKILKNVLKIKLLDAFRIKTPDEKLFRKMCKEEELRNKLN